jgi:hypothetical protein
MPLSSGLLRFARNDGTEVNSIGLKSIEIPRGGSVFPETHSGKISFFIA